MAKTGINCECNAAGDILGLPGQRKMKTYCIVLFLAVSALCLYYLNTISNSSPKKAIVLRELCDSIRQEINGLLNREKLKIAGDAPFAYESDTLSSECTYVNDNKIMIGRWEIARTTDDGIKAYIQKTYGGSGEFVTESLTITFSIISTSHVKVLSWKAKQDFEN